MTTTDDDGVTTYPCGCRNARDHGSGVLLCVSKCQFHVDFSAAMPKGEEYYRKIGLLDIKGQVRSEHYTAELVEAIGPIPPPPPQFAHRRLPEALEIGCGVSPYVAAIQEAGYAYTGLDPDPYATARTALEGLPGHPVNVITEPFRPNVWLNGMFDLVLFTHSLEHLPDGPTALAEAFRILVPGGRVLVLVPDDEDPTNPDHLWFFNEATLRGCLERAGFVIERFAVRRIVPHENFLYCLARKPL